MPIVFNSQTFNDGETAIFNNNALQSIKRDATEVWKGQDIPAEYLEVSCIVTSGSQYINTQCALFANNAWEIDMEFATPVSTGYNPIFGVLNDSSANYRAWFTSPTFFFRYNGSNVNLVVNAVVGTKYTRKCVYNGSTLVITDENGTTISSTVIAKATNSNPVTFFLYPNNHYGTMKLYHCKMYSGGTLVRDFYPAVRRSDGVVGLYDNVNNVFYTNNGSGSFTYES